MGLSIRLISGADHSSRQRFHATLLRELSQRDCLIDEVFPGGLAESMSFWSLSDDPVAFCIEISGKEGREKSEVDIDLAIELKDSPVKNRIVIFHVPGKLKTQKLKDLGSWLGKFWTDFEEVPPWKAEKTSVDLCLREASRHGKQMSRGVAKTVSLLCGNDVGFVCFEVEKLCLYADFENKDEIDGAILSAGYSGRHEASIFRLGERFAKLTMKEWIIESDRVYLSMHSDPTMLLCRFLSSYLLKRIRALSLHYAGFSMKESAKELGSHPWQFENVLLPSAKTLGKEKMVRLLQRLADVEQSVFRGDSHPWIHLQTAVGQVLMT